MSLFYGFEVKDIQVKDIPTDDKDAVNKRYADTKLSLSGGTMKGDLDMNSQAIKNIKDAVDGGDAINRNYLEKNYFVKRSTAGTVQLTLNGNNFVNQSSLHSGWPKVKTLNGLSVFRVLFDGFLIDRDNIVPLAYDFRSRLMVFDKDFTQTDFDINLYDNTNSTTVPISTSISNRLGSCFYRNDGSYPFIDINIWPKSAICIIFQTKEVHGMTGNEIWMDYHIEY